ncbi:MAG: hypothetical protein CVV41_11955 [Candidatus Riflebacteria bacterium HGW-Riflebacteria-1]|jgi:uncharacterized membrane protein (GlpM family)|nr:MAG: hypothetical protein CVV41_11955 [Candidatus Riflebacteria bacterium HGW-Riflebacteria-1]
MQYLIKIVITALLVVGISEASKRNQYAGAILASLPVTSILAISWFYYETASKEQTAALSTSIMWMVVPSLAFFIALPLLLRRDFSFLSALGISSAVTFASYAVFFKIIGALKLV